MTKRRISSNKTLKRTATVWSQSNGVCLGKVAGGGPGREHKAALGAVTRKNRRTSIRGNGIQKTQKEVTWKRTWTTGKHVVTGKDERSAHESRGKDLSDNRKGDRKLKHKIRRGSQTKTSSKYF